VLHVLWYYVLPLPDTGAAGAAGVARGKRWRLVSTLAAAVAGAAVLLALFATPHGTVLAERVPLRADSPRTLEVVGDSANVTLVLLDGPLDELAIDGELHGFGLPGSRLAAGVDLIPPPHPALRYRIASRGWLTDVDGMATLRVPAAAFDRVSVSLGRGNIRVSDLTRAGVLASGRVHLELRTARGHIQPSG
jgi:lipid A 4'-phosphatase